MDNHLFGAEVDLKREISEQSLKHNSPELTGFQLDINQIEASPKTGRCLVDMTKFSPYSLTTKNYKVWHYPVPWILNAIQTLWSLLSFFFPGKYSVTVNLINMYLDY